MEKIQRTANDNRSRRPGEGDGALSGRHRIGLGRAAGERAPSVSAASARELVDCVATIVGHTWRSSSTIAARPSRRASRTPPRSGGRRPGRAAPTPAGASRPGCGRRPRSRAARARAPPAARERCTAEHRGRVDVAPQRELDRRVRHRPVLILVCPGHRHLPDSTRLRHKPLPTRLADDDDAARPARPPASRRRSPRACRRAARCARARRWSAPARASGRARWWRPAGRPGRPRRPPTRPPPSAKAANAAAVSASNWVTSVPTASRTRSTAVS